MFLEFFAFFVMLFLGYLILIKNNNIQCKWKNKSINRWILVFAIYFSVNTLGNLLAETTFEKA